MLDLNTLKENIQTLLEVANTTTASVDLSYGLQKRIEKVLKVNPTRIPIQTTHLNFVTVYIASKDIEQKTIAMTQLDGARRAEIDVKIIGAVWNNIYTNKDVDEADDDCESLMENIEQILRASPTLSNFALWSFPTSVTYHSSNVDEGTNLRAGVLTLKVSAFY